MWIVLSALLVFLLLTVVYIDYFNAPENVIPSVTPLPSEIESLVYPIEDLTNPIGPGEVAKSHVAPFPQRLGVSRGSLYEIHPDTDFYPGSSIVAYKTIKGTPNSCMKECGGLYADCRSFVYDDFKKTCALNKVSTGETFKNSGQTLFIKP